MVANVKEIGRRIRVHNVTVSAAGIAFYGLLALVPTLIALVSIYGLVADPAEIETQVADATESLDATTSEFVVQQLRDIVGDAESEDGSSSMFGRWAGLVLGIVVALFSASGAVQKLMGTVSLAYEAEETRPGWKLRIIAYVFTAGAIVGIALMILAIGVIPNLLDSVDLGGAAESAISILTLPVLGLLFAGALTILYRYTPDRAVKTPWRNPGAIVGTLLFIFFAVAFSIYSANVGALPASYGLLGSIAALMIFLQLTALAVIIGAEVNGAIEVRSNAAAKAKALAGGGALVPAGTAGSVDAEGDDSPGTLSFGKALAGLIALFALGKGMQGD
jgi:membrane protein